MNDSQINRLISLGESAVEAIEQRGGQARLLGGIGIELAAERPSSLSRAIEDVDVITRRRDRKSSEIAMRSIGLLPDTEINSIHGAKRQIWWTQDGHDHLDLFLGELRMCHTLSFDGRLDGPGQALQPADLLLTKLQIVELTDKDVGDIATLLLSHEADMTRIIELCAADWGLCTTVQDNLAKLGPNLQRLAPCLDRSAVDRAAALSARIEAAPKTGRWRLRSRLGRRARWYELPDEVLS